MALLGFERSASLSSWNGEAGTRGGLGGAVEDGEELGILEAEAPEEDILSMKPTLC